MMASFAHGCPWKFIFSAEVIEASNEVENGTGYFHLQL